MRTLWGVLTIVLVLVLAAGYAGLCVYIGIDMNRRGPRGWLFGVLAAVAPVVGSIIWLIARASRPIPNRNAESPTATV